MRALALLLLLAAGCAAPSHELLLRGGTLVDGTGTPARPADLAIDDGRIVAIGDLAGHGARRTIDATGLVVAPGFVDLHGHADLLLLADRERRDALLEAKIRQGVTTLIVGNCGLGSAPADAEAAALLAGVNGWMTPEGVDAAPGSFADYLERLDAARLPIHVGALLPHGPLRIGELGLEARDATPAELERMRGALAAGLEAGAFGLSVGLIYPPGMTTPTDELTALAREIARHDALFTAHVRGSSELLLDATDELIAVARASGARVHHSHLEAVGRDYWPWIDEVLAREDAARAEGLPLSHDVFLYDRAATMMVAIFPPWSLEGGVPALLERLRPGATRERIRRELLERPSDRDWPHNLVRAVGWDGILIGSVPEGGPAQWVGRDLAAIGKAEGRDPFDVVADLMIDSDGRVGQLVAEISGEQGLLTILTHPAAMVISDAEDYGRGVPHPAHAGAFVRALRWNREHALEPLEAMVARMTGRPAALLGLERRGTLVEGAPADLVLFDPATVGDTADWSAPRSFASGVPWVIVAGDPVVDNGAYVPGSSGGVLRSSRSPSGAATSASTIRSDARPSP